MILKYKFGEVWGYIDSVKQVCNKYIDNDKLIKQYDLEVNKGSREDTASKDAINDAIANSNKVFLMATESIDTDELGESHTENLIDEFSLDFPTFAIALYLNDHKTYETLILITNQKTFLMNDKGQTIERLV